MATLSGIITPSNVLTATSTATLTNKTWNSNTIGVAYGGTGVTSAGTAGNVLTSNGTVWQSAAPSGSANLQEFSTSAVWTKPSSATFVMVEALGAGGGGGSGRSGSSGTDIWAGTGGGGGAYAYRIFKASDLPSSVLVTVGAGGAGGASITASDTNGSNGVAGGNSQFGQFLIAYRGDAGLAGSAASDGGIGGGVLGTNGVPVNDGGNVTSGTFQGAFGRGGGQMGNGASRTYSSGFGGGGGGGNANKGGTATTGAPGGCSYQGGSGGGGGGTISATPLTFSGGAGGSIAGDSGGGGVAGVYGKGGNGAASRFGGGGGKSSETVSSLVLGGIAYGDSKFVTTSSNTIICVSSDNGATWTQQAAVSIGNQTRIYYLNGQWVIISGSPNIIATSTNLTSWSLSIPPANVSGLAFNSGTYVMVATAGQIYTSTDLIKFTYQNSGTTQSLNDVIHDGSRWIVVGANGVSLTSTDAISWTIVTTASSGNWFKVASSGSVIVATSSATPFAWRSTDNGASWSPVSTTLTASGNIIYAGSQFVIAVSSNVYTSSDGNTWTTQTDGTTDNYGGIAYSGTAYAISSSTSNSNAAITSPTGVTWTTRTFASVTYPATPGGSGGIAAGGGGGAAIVNGTAGGSGAGGAGGNGLVRVYTW